MGKIVMNRKQFMIVAYDISNNRRRTKLHDLLMDYGTPVQYSVFEFEITPKQYQRMKKAIKKLIKPRLDRVRIYYLCEDCRKKRAIIGKKDKDNNMVILAK